MGALHDLLDRIIHKTSWHSEEEKAQVLATVDELRTADEPAPAEPAPVKTDAPTTPAPDLPPTEPLIPA